MTALLAAVLAALACAPPVGGTRAQEECLDCHGKKEDLRAALEKNSRPVPDDLGRFAVDAAAHKASRHRSVGCEGCHELEEYPHPEDAVPVACAECHEEAADAAEVGLHEQARKKGNGDAPECTDC
ncbi:MAG: hypothetical protein ACYTAF_04865, partial [Planctomycetota bacterium]